MIRHCAHTLVLLLTAWVLYYRCQEDLLLPVVAAVILVLSLLARRKTLARQFTAFAKMPLSAVIISSFIFGLFWRNIFPPLGESPPPFPLVTAAVQSGSIVAAALLWLKPFSRENLTRLTFAAWLTVATSINVPFTQDLLLIFLTFCILTVAVAILNTIKRPAKKERLGLYYRDYVIFATLLVLLTSALFGGIARTIAVIDRLSVQFLSDYVLPRYYTHFLRIDPFLRLEAPGESALDRRPVLEIALPRADRVYLRMQVFRDFDDGVWQEEKNQAVRPLSAELDPKLPRAELMIFTPFEDIVPSPNGVVAGRGPGTLSLNEDDILLTEDKQRSRILELSVQGVPRAAEISRVEAFRYTRIPPDIAVELRSMSDDITGDADTSWEKARMTREYFINNFEYTLKADFRADNQGIASMIREKRPAYCSYFATAMTLLLRSQGIPARVVTGFLTDERIDRRDNRFLARVKDAHAWVQALLPVADPRTGQTIMTWQGFDPTPFSLRARATAKPGFQYERFLERMGLGLLRTMARAESIDRERLKKWLLFFFIAVLLLMNRQPIWNGLLKLFRRSRRAIPKRRGRPDPLLKFYRQYENYLKASFDEVRRESETDAEILARLKSRADVPGQALAGIEAFINDYRAARFGRAKGIELKQSLEVLTEKS